MKLKRVLFALLLAAVLTGCSKQPVPRHIVILPDVSGSIDRQALNQAFKAIDELVSHLHRGDRIAIIPILGDAQAEASGRIIRFEVPTNRQAYDSDLRHFSLKLKASLEEMRSAAVVHPGSRTDILGSVALAEQEFKLASGQPKRLLVILSDFIQEDREMNFRNDKRLIKETAAKEYATRLGRASSLILAGVTVYLGLLRSRELAQMSQERRNTVHIFWIKYFQSIGSQPTFVTDGSGLLSINLASNMD